MFQPKKKLNNACFNDWGSWLYSWNLTDVVIQSAGTLAINPVAIIVSHNQTVFSHATIWLTRVKLFIDHVSTRDLPDPVTLTGKVSCSKPKWSVLRLNKRRKSN